MSAGYDGRRPNGAGRRRAALSMSMSVSRSALVLAGATLLLAGALAAPPVRAVSVAVPTTRAEAGRRPPPFEVEAVDADRIGASISAARPLPWGRLRVTGITVPHHLVAADLIATGFRAARPPPGAPPVARIVVLLPDHYKRSARPFATTQRAFRTAFGPVPVDRAAVASLLASRDVEASSLFGREHGLTALLPYLRSSFPGVPIVPLAIAIRSTPAQWARIEPRLAALLTPATLVVQSTDYSHHLARADAVRQDQRTLNQLAIADPAALQRAAQPAQLDARGAQVLMLALQRRVFGAAPIVYANRNSADRGDTAEDDTTSYIAQIHTPDAADRVLAPAEDDGTATYCFAGDSFFGRHVATYLGRPGVAERVQRELGRRLGGCRLIVNLEGVALPEADLARLGPMPPPGRLPMPLAATIAALHALRVEAVVVANNHSHDLGAEAYAAMVAALRAEGLPVLEHGRVERLGALRVVALRDLENLPTLRERLIGSAELDAIEAAASTPTPTPTPTSSRPGPTPLVAFVHGGTEFAADPDPRQRELAIALAARGVSIVVGAHPHRASRSLETLAGDRTLYAPSLGNFVFDQRGPRVSAAVLQVTVFAQGAVASRWLPLPSLYDLLRSGEGGARNRSAHLAQPALLRVRHEVLQQQTR
jgi:AmmeMemoRadiSam system protein B